MKRMKNKRIKKMVMLIKVKSEKKDEQGKEIGQFGDNVIIFTVTITNYNGLFLLLGFFCYNIIFS